MSYIGPGSPSHAHGTMNFQWLEWIYDLGMCPEDIQAWDMARVANAIPMYDCRFEQRITGCLDSGLL